MTKLNLPNESLTNNNYTSEANYLKTLYDTKPRSNSGNISFTSTTSGIIYTTTGSLYDSQGQEGLLLILQDALKDYGFNAGDYNTINDNLTNHLENNDIHVTLEKQIIWTAKYEKPSLGIPITDLVASAQTGVNRANSITVSATDDARYTIKTVDGSWTTSVTATYNAWITTSTFSFTKKAGHRLLNLNILSASFFISSSSFYNTLANGVRIYVNGVLKSTIYSTQSVDLSLDAYANDSTCTVRIDAYNAYSDAFKTNVAFVSKVNELYTIY